MSWKTLLHLGTREHYPQFLNIKLRNSAFMGFLVLLTVVLHVTSLSAKGFPKLAFIPGMEGIWILTAFALMKAGAYRVPRVMISIAPMLTTYMFKALAVPAGITLSPGYYMLILVSTIFPFLVFDLREKFWLYLTLSISLFLFATVNINSEWLFGIFELHNAEDPSTISSDNVARINAILGLLAALYYIESSQLKSTILSEKMQDEARQKTDELVSSEQELKNMISKLDENRIEEQERNRVNEILSEFGTMLRNKTNDVQEQYDQLISFIVKSVGANQASLFVVEHEGDEAHLQMKACYAFNRKKFLEKKIQIGQGLVGQAYLEKEKTYLTEIPQNYVKITSGLGDANPTCLLVLPMLYQEKVEAILELASFQPLTELQLDMLEKMGEALASQISAYRIQHQTQSLLESRQKQSEELLSREEELRQNMEELQGTQEDMQRKEQFYLKQIEELQQTLQQYQMKED